jgi:hypothetical protein
VARKALEQILGDRASPSDVRERAQVLMAEIIAADMAKGADASGAAGKDTVGKTNAVAKKRVETAPAPTTQEPADRK